MRVLRSVTQSINAIKTVHDIKKTNELASELFDQFTPANAANYLKMDFSPIQCVALILVIPANYAPSEMYNACKKTFRVMSDLDPKIQSGLMMRFAKCAFLSNQESECLGILDSFTKIDQNIFLAPYLYLTATTKHPVDIIPRPNPYIRMYTFSLYYAGINHLLLKKYKTALSLFLYCLHLPCQEELQQATVNGLSCACFLSQIPYEQFIALIPPKIELNNDTLVIWKGHKQIPQQKHNFSSIYTDLWNEICDERIRRNIVFFSKSISKMPFSKYKEFCGCYDEAKIRKITNSVNDKQEAKIVIDENKNVTLESIEKNYDLNSIIKEVENLVGKAQHEKILAIKNSPVPVQTTDA